MPDTNGGLQLLPVTRKKIEVSASPGQNKLLMIAAGFLGLVLLLFLGLWLYNQQILTKKLDAANAAVKAVEESRDKTSETKLLALKDNLALVRPLLSDHVTWSNAFKRIQRLVSPQVQFTALAVNLDRNEYTFKALAPNFATVARQVAAFYSDDAITEVLVSKLTTQTTGKVEFVALLNLNLDKLVRKNRQP